MAEEQIYYAYVTILNIRHLSDRWIHFSLQSTDLCNTTMEKYYQYKETDDYQHFLPGTIIWKVCLYRDSDIIKSIEKKSGYSCNIF